jgi:hypothetical protein
MEVLEFDDAHVCLLPSLAQCRETEFESILSANDVRGPWLRDVMTLTSWRSRIGSANSV